MSDLEILVDYYKAIDAKHIIPTKLDPLDCNTVKGCNVCSFNNACSYLGNKELEDNSSTWQCTYFKLHIKPLMRKKEYSKENLQHYHPELFI